MSEQKKEKSGARVARLGATLLEGAVEALIFAAEDPIPVAILAETFAEVTGGEIPGDSEVEEAIVRLNGVYETSDRAFRIEKWGKGFRYATRPDFAPFLEALFVTGKQRKLTRTLMESLAILAYRQPASKSELEFVRGVDCDYALRKLMEYGLIDIVGRGESVGRPLLYGTTDRFLELFGLSALSDLPNLRELESILDDPAFQKEKARMLLTTLIQLPLASVEDNEHIAESALKSETNEEKED